MAGEMSRLRTPTGFKPTETENQRLRKKANAGPAPLPTEMQRLRAPSVAPPKPPKLHVVGQDGPAQGIVEPDEIDRANREMRNLQARMLLGRRTRSTSFLSTPSIQARLLLGRQLGALIPTPRSILGA